MSKIDFVEYKDNRIVYKNNGSEILFVRIDVYDNYTNSFMFSNDVDLYPYIEIFTYMPYIWNITEIYIYDRITNELLFNYKINGIKKLNQYDEYGYILRLFQMEKERVLQGSLNSVIGEHFYNIEYQDIVDIEPGDVVIDVGFNYGIFSLHALYNRAYKIYGFEPNIDIYNKIKNIYPERDKVQIFNYAVSDENKEMIFYSSIDTVCSTVSFIKDNCKQYKVQCINLNDFILENNIEKIDLLKIDCEGEEYKIFDSISDDVFLKIRKMIVEFHFNDGVVVNTLIDKFNRLNYKWQFSNNVDYNSEVGLIFAKKIN